MGNKGNIRGIGVTRKDNGLSVPDAGVKNAPNRPTTSKAPSLGRMGSMTPPVKDYPKNNR